MKRCTLTVIGLLAGALYSSHAQADSSAELWLGPAVEYGLADDLELSITQDIRFYEDVSALQSLMPTLEVAYRFLPALKVVGGYRFAYEAGKNDEFRTRQRLHFDAQASHRWGPLKGSYRQRLQTSFRDGETRSKWRHRLKFKLAMNDDYDVAASAESFHVLGEGYEKLRTTIGVGRTIGGQDVALFYRNEFPVDEDEPTLHIIGLGFEYSID